MHRSRFIVSFVMAAMAVVAFSGYGMTPAPGFVGAQAPEPSLDRFAWAEVDYGTKARETSPEDWMLAQRLSSGPITPASVERAARQSGAITALTARSATASVKAPPWLFAGPTTIGGRIMDIALDPHDDNVLWVAAASGGVWKSADGGQTFQQSWPANGTQAIGALTIDSQGVLLAGTGEAGPGGGSITFGGRGVFRSADGGKTWQRRGLGGTQRISRIVVDPTDDQTIFVAAMGDLFSPGGSRGLYRSNDGGQTWKLVLPGATSTTGASDIAIDPSNPDRVYAVMWDAIREPARRVYGGLGSGVYRSDDGGDSWTRMENGLPAPSANLGRIGLALAPSNPDHLYAIAIDTVGFFLGFYQSIDGGDSWTKLPNDRLLQMSQSSFGWWFGRIWVDPKVESHVFVAGVPLLESFTAGTSWVQQSVVLHADQHAMVWDPDIEGRVYVGNDGGVYKSDTNGTGAWTKATSEPYTQFYTIDVSEQDPSRIVGGTQDNGCNRSYPDDWNTYGCGDGLETLINPVDQNIVYGCSQYGSCFRSNDGGETRQGISGDTTSQRRNWLTPLVFDPNDPSIIYYAGNILNRSTDGGDNWTPISPDLTGGDPYPGSDEPYPYGTITTVAPAKSDGNVIFVGTDDHRVWYTRDQGQTWTQATDPDLPAAWVTRIVVHPKNANVAYATFSGFRQDDPSSYVYKTIDGGVNWRNISGNLPAAPVNAIVLRGRQVIVGSDRGVFVTEDGGETWFRLGRGLPRAPVMDLRLHGPSNALFAATFGRGIYEVLLPS